MYVRHAHKRHSESSVASLLHVIVGTRQYTCTVQVLLVDGRGSPEIIAMHKINKLYRSMEKRGELVQGTTTIIAD